MGGLLNELGSKRIILLRVACSEIEKKRLTAVKNIVIQISANDCLLIWCLASALFALLSLNCLLVSMSDSDPSLSHLLCFETKVICKTFLDNPDKNNFFSNKLNGDLLSIRRNRLLHNLFAKMSRLASTSNVSTQAKLQLRKHVREIGKE